jgi:hypothetical protein
MLAANESLNHQYIEGYKKAFLGEVLDMTMDQVMEFKGANDNFAYQKSLWDDVPTPSMNYFMAHRFFVIKGFNYNSHLAAASHQQSPYKMNSNFEMVDVMREMGEFIPNEINAIINN